MSSATATPRKPKTIHLVCNAHLDPVWQWPWEDGLTEAISTFRVAADFCERHEDFVFNHNESLLYGWILKHEPALFARMQKLVKAGRWHIAGGAFLQPDVNTPGGESHIRQFLLGLEFFKQHFNQRPTTAYNFDPFGHAEGFAQLLAGCGMDSYIFCRPDFGTYDLPVGTFQWSDRSGQSVLARRSDDHYLTRPGTHHAVPTKFPQYLKHFSEEPTTMLLWGIGNHGGGVSRLEFEQIQTFASEHPEYRFVQSTPEAFFAAVRSEARKLPQVQGEIERSFPGCYTSMSRVKRAYRATEHLVMQTERRAALAWWFDGVTYPAEQLDACWRDILFCTFHDILPGSGIPRAEKDALATLGGTQDRLRRLRFDTFVQQTRHHTPAKEGDVPLFVTNPHGFEVEQPVELDYTVAWLGGHDKAIRLRDGRRDVPFQRISAEHNLGGQDVVRLVAPLRLKPFETRRIDASLVPGKPMTPQPAEPTAEFLNLASEAGVVRINPRTGLIDAITAKGGRRSLVKPGAMQPVLFQDLDHSWTCGDPSQMKKPQSMSQAPAWKKIDAKFRLATAKECATISPLPTDKWCGKARTAARPIRVIEHGELRTTIEALFVCDGSWINRHYILCRRSGRLEVRDRVFFTHPDHMLKLAFPLNFKPLESRSESLYSVVKRQPTANFEDRHNQRWVAAEDEQGNYLAVVNDGSFAHCLTRDTLAVNVMRSPAYTSFIIQPGDPFNDCRFAPRHDQGEHEVRYLLQWGNRVNEGELTRLADAFNAEPYTYVYYPAGSDESSPQPSGLAATVKVTSPHVRIVALKRSQRGDALVVRLQETTGRPVRCQLCLGDQTTPIRLRPYELATMMISKTAKGINAQMTNLVEGL